MGAVDREDLLSALDALTPEVDNESWVEVGAALHHEGVEFEVFDEWSSRDTRPGKYSHRECEKRWRSFGHQSGEPVTGRTVIRRAMDAGWHPTPKGHAFGWDDAVDIPEVPEPRKVALTAGDVSEEDVPEGPPASAADEAARYLRALFRPDEHVGFVVAASDVSKSDSGKWVPASSGTYSLTCQQLLDAIERHPEDLSYAFGTPRTEAGAWVHINPLDGGGVKDANISDYRHALVESDSLPVGKQLALIHALGLPCAAVVTSGGKSVHAVVRVDAANRDQYRTRTQQLYNLCKANGLEVDKQNRNPSRLSRLPGFRRGGRWQRLVETDVGPASWAEWQDALTGLPPIQPLSGIREVPPLAPELISGVLREGQKMMLTGPSKAGKSFSMIELAIAIATGGSWLGRPCRKGTVLYANMEIDPDSFLHRVVEVYRSMRGNRDGRTDVELLHELSGFHVWNLRGHAAPLDKLEPMLTRRAAKMGEDYTAFIVDPIYKILPGDENSATDMAVLCNSFDRIAVNLHSAVIYSHHHAKGAAGARSAIDRGSGSGVFARDPDALVDLTPLDGHDDCYRVEMTLREFASPKPFAIEWRYPVHVLRPDLDGERVVGEPMSRRETLDRATEAAAAGRTQLNLGRAALTASALAALGGTDVTPEAAMAWMESEAPAECARLRFDLATLKNELKPARKDFPFVRDGSKKYIVPA